MLLLCYSFGNCTVGTFNEASQATKFCMSVKDTAVYMDGMSDEDINDERYNPMYMQLVPNILAMSLYIVL